MAKQGAKLHEVPDEDVEKASRLRSMYAQLIRWSGRAAAHHQLPGVPPNRTPKADWPDRPADVRRALALERSQAEQQEQLWRPKGSGIGGGNGKQWEAAQYGPPPASHHLKSTIAARSHSQFLSPEAIKNLAVGSRLSASARVKRSIRQVEEDRDRHKLFDQVASEIGRPLNSADEQADDRLEPALCKGCNTYRKLTFVEGRKSRIPCACMLRAKRRRLTYKQPDKAGAFDEQVGGSEDLVHRRDAMGHLVMVYESEGLSWCNLCGAFSNTHIKDLGRPCVGIPGPGKKAVLGRLRRGRHPMSNQQFSSAAKRLKLG